MRSTLKAILKSILGAKGFQKLTNYKRFLSACKNLGYNYFIDCKLYSRDSTVFRTDNYSKIEAKIILDYHSVEKGLLYRSPKDRFAKDRILSLHRYLSEDIIVAKRGNTQIEVAYKIMCQYYEMHKEKGVDIGDYYTIIQYEMYKNLLDRNYTNDFGGAIYFTQSDFYNANQANFYDFSYSRKSIRNFTGKKIDFSQIKLAIQLASNAPSVCNRQASKVYLIEDKQKIDSLLKIQGGFTGYTDNVVQLLIVTIDRNYFYTIGERNQFYIDGGIFLMNLLYSLHYYKIANCPANWGKTIQEEKLVETCIHLPHSEKIICMVPIGLANDDFKVCLSKRRDVDEFFRVV